MKRIALLVIPLLLFSACKKNTFTIEGTFENGADKTIYLCIVTPRDGEKEVTTMTLDDKGHFKLREQLEYLTFYNLHVNENDYVMLLPHPGEHLTLTGNYNDLTHSYDVKGSPESTLLWLLQDYSNKGSQALADLVKKNKENKASLSPEEYQDAKKATDTVFMEIRNQQVNYMENFIYDNKGSLTTLIALYKPFNDHLLLPPQSCYELYTIVLEGLQDQLPNNPHTINFKNTAIAVENEYAN